jgi:hypothetical protein
MFPNPTPAATIQSASGFSRFAFPSSCPTDVGHLHLAVPRSLFSRSLNPRGDLENTDLKDGRPPLLVNKSTYTCQNILLHFNHAESRNAIILTRSYREVSFRQVRSQKLSATSFLLHIRLIDMSESCEEKKRNS